MTVTILDRFKLNEFDIDEHLPAPAGRGKVRIFEVKLDGREIGWVNEWPGPRFTLDAPNGMSLIRDGGSTLAEAATALKEHDDWVWKDRS
jgi:hypothetical protein